ncbi:phosphoadenosine phosphosulfate reductase family protein [Paenibacillus sp. GXUN7292]|uniref:phosphoadenosine phosphosulfate reductase domain-containing protein n=1 Tax=Paenibacillus sp. GXUN7292 TaxID=3422499 RepID=UPI003D7D235A
MQLTWDFECQVEYKVEETQKAELLPLDEYDKILISSSSGKDSNACLFHLLNEGVPKEKLELHHQCVDGYGEQHVEFMDWPITESYLTKIGQHFGIRTFFQWRAFGFKGELLRKDSLTKDIYYVNDKGETVHLPTTRGNKSTRLRWPAMGADLRTRWCSPYVKIDIFRRMVSHDPRFKGSKDKPVKLLVITGERRQESANRAKYAEVEVHPSSSSHRLVHAWRPVIDWKEENVWDQYEKYRILPHPAYLLGWNRTSCFGCIFTTADLWAIMREIAPERFNELVRMERELNHTIDAKLTLEQKANLGSLERLPKDARTSKWVHMALNRQFETADLIMDKWELPAGAFRVGGGPI